MALNANALLNNKYCLEEVSKNIDGQVTVLNAIQMTCSRPTCEPLTLVQLLRLNVRSNPDCDSKLGAILDGSMEVRDLTTVYAGPSEHRRGVHAANFAWRVAG